MRQKRDNYVFLPVIINKCYLQINKCYHLTTSKFELQIKEYKQTIQCWCLCTDYYRVMYNYHFPVRIIFALQLWGDQVFDTPPRLELKGKTKQKNTELRGRFYGRFSNKLEISCWLRLASSACSGLDHGDPAAIRFRSQACNSAFNILEHTQTASPLTMPYCPISNIA